MLGSSSTYATSTAHQEFAIFLHRAAAFSEAPVLAEMYVAEGGFVELRAKALSMAVESRLNRDSAE